MLFFPGSSYYPIILGSCKSYSPSFAIISTKHIPLRVYGPLPLSNQLYLAPSNCLNQDYNDFHQDGISVVKKSNEIEKEVIQGLLLKITTSNEVEKNVESVRAMLKSINDGETNISPYSTAWVALVKDIQGMEGGPQFPSSLQWIIDNQLSDGSWGDDLICSAYDRIINTMACLVALKSWGVYPDLQDKGITFLKENMNKLENEKDEHMPIGFEVNFPVLIEIAEKHGIEVAQNCPTLQSIYAKRKLKLSRVPWKIMHTMHTTLLCCLEGMPDLDWKRLLKLQSQDGSFLYSPSSTAYALMQTGDLKCLNYLNKVIEKFNGGAPNFYPMDLQERLWVVDRLQRLGISRYFQVEIKECMIYVYRYWTEKGIGWTRNSEVQDIDDTAMGFRLLRLHGYEVSADVFKNFVKDGEFLCTACQSKAGVTVTYNLLRAAQLEYHGEKILEEARNYAIKYLREKQASNQLFDKWVIAKDIPGEVAYGLDIPWYANLPRVEARFYIEQYGGANDVWIGKTFYRLPYVNNNAYLELAKMDYNNCQALHKLEYDSILRWYSKNDLEDFGVSQRSLLLAYFLALATIFEPEKSKEHLAWAKTATLVEAIASNFDKEVTYKERKDFILEFQSSYLDQDFLGEKRSMPKNKGHVLVGPLLSTLNQISIDALVTHGRDIHSQLYQIVKDSRIHRTRKMDAKAEDGIQKLVELVLSSSFEGVDSSIKQTCLAVAKTFYYKSYCSPQEIDDHIARVLFQKVD